MLRELKTFVAVARHGTFAAAGMHMTTSQAATMGARANRVLRGCRTIVPFRPFAGRSVGAACPARPADALRR